MIQAGCMLFAARTSASATERVAPWPTATMHNAAAAQADTTAARADTMTLGMRTIRVHQEP